MPCLSFCSNAYFGRAECELAFEQTANQGNRQFFQRFVSEDKILTFPHRCIDVPATAQFISSLSSYAHKGRANRAINQYHAALSYWQLGNKLLALAHLFMAAEALAKAVLEQYLESTVTTRDVLSNLWFVKVKDLQAAARRRLIFKDDGECHHAAKDASGAFEHGFTDFHQIRPLATQFIVKTARYVRESVVALSGLCSTSAALLLASPFDKPVGPLRLETYLWGKLIGDVQDPAAEGQAYPIMQWKSAMKSYTRASDGTYSFEPEHTITPRIADGVQFRAERLEIWDGSTIHEGTLPQDEMTDR